MRCITRNIDIPNSSPDLSDIKNIPSNKILAGVPFLYVAGSQFDDKYVGVGAKRVRKLFEAAR